MGAPVSFSGAESAVRQIIPFFMRRFPPQCRVAVRETTKAPDHVAMQFGIAQELSIAQR